MSSPADIISSTSFGRNLTPVGIIESVRRVLKDIDLDPCSDSVANKFIKANQYYSKEEDGYSRNWRANTLYVNPPGTSITRDFNTSKNLWLKDLAFFESKDKDVKPLYSKQVKAANWYKKLHEAYREGSVANAIYMVYRAGSIGSLSQGMLTDSQLCLTCKDSLAALDKENKSLNSSGRISFDYVNEQDERYSGTKNTQSSIIGLLSRDSDMHVRFIKEFSKYGVIMDCTTSATVLNHL